MTDQKLQELVDECRSLIDAGEIQRATEVGEQVKARVSEHVILIVDSLATAFDMAVNLRIDGIGMNHHTEFELTSNNAEDVITRLLEKVGERISKGEYVPDKLAYLYQTVNQTANNIIEAINLQIRLDQEEDSDGKVFIVNSA